MKVKNLIKELMGVDPEAEVVSTSSNFEMKGSVVPKNTISIITTARKTSEGFRDAFDGTPYRATVYQLSGGKETVVKI